MTAWTMDNTEGFTQPQLDVINEAIEIIKTAAPGVDESNINDAINNAWNGGETAEELARKTRLI